MKIAVSLLMFCCTFLGFSQERNSNYKIKRVAVAESIIIDSVSINPSKFVVKTIDDKILDSTSYTIDFSKALLRFKRPIEIDSGFIDSYRHLHPEKQEFSWWSYRANARANNKGWRLDYAMVSQPLQEKIKRSVILTEAVHSDHCPILLELNL